MIIPVILAGGSGTRLWPESRKHLPKQFLPLISEQSMLQETVQRLKGLEIHPPIVLTNEEQRFLAAEQLREIGIAATILLEPEGKNTAASIALAAQYAKQNIDASAQLLVLAADHAIQDISAFQKVISSAIPLSKKGFLVTFGVNPDVPSTEYGYICVSGDPVDDFGSRKIEKFVEKPNKKTADSYLKSGNYLWNSGMFMFGADTYLDELNQHRPDIALVCAQAAKFEKDLDFVRINAVIFKNCPEESIDYAVMEKTTNAIVMPLNAGWSDIGSWSSLWELLEKDENENAVKGDAVLQDSHRNLIYGEDRLIATLGIDDLAIVDTKDALLVAHKENAHQIKSLVESIKQRGGIEHNFHRMVYRPWGHYDSIDQGQGFQVKRITVKPGQKLSVQMHNHRAEHWVVVSGQARVSKDEETFILKENESTYIPIGCVHALENPNDTPLELIEVQSGSYLGEDDIVRFEDRYGRIKEIPDK